MDEAFSPAVKEWLDAQDALRIAEERFRQEWGAMLASAQRRLAGQGWNSSLTHSPPDEIKLFRPDWPAGAEGMHYEARAFPEQFRRGVAELALHLEGDVPNQPAVCARLRRLLARHADRVLGGLAEAMPHEPVQDILRSSLPLVGATDETLGLALERLMRTDSFADEALFLRDGRTVWRTDFLPGDPQPYLKWHEGLGTGEQGGWEMKPDGGRLGTACLACDATRTNYHEGQNILTLQTGEMFRAFAGGRTMYAAAVVLAKAGGQLTFYGEASKEGKWQEAFRGTRPLQPIGRWQVVVWEQPVCSAKGYDFARQGLWAFVMVKAPPGGLWIDSIEIGLRD